MSNLGSVSNETVLQENIKNQQNNPNNGAAIITTYEKSIEQVNKLFTSASVADHTNAVKILISLMSQGHDVSVHSPKVVQMVVSNDPVGRQLAYVFLNHYAEDAPESIVLSVNTFQRSLTDSDPLTRALAMKVMSSIRSREVFPAVSDAIQQVVGDPSPYVKKAAALSIIKMAEMASSVEESEQYLPILERLMSDKSPIALSGALATYWSICPDNIEFIHPIFRSLCHNMKYMDPWGQMFALRSLTVYARYCFKNPVSIEDDEAIINFWDEGNSSETLSADMILLIQTAKKMLMSPNSAVVMAAVSLIYYTAPTNHLSSVARPLIRLLYESQLMCEIALTTIITIAKTNPSVFVPHLSHFFVRRSDIMSVKKLKLKLLTLLASQSNIDQVLSELSMYTGSSDHEFAASAVKTIGKAANINESVIPSALVTLLKLLSRAEGKVLSEVVLVISHILRKRRGTEDEAHAFKQLCRKFVSVKEPSARAAILSIVGDMHETHPQFSPQLLRHIAKNFDKEPAEVRLQSLTLAAKLIACNSESKVPLYLLKLSERDNEFDVRDRARFLLAILETENEELRSKIKGLLFPPRREPNWSALEVNNAFQIGTFSHLFNRNFIGYDPLPEWAPEDSLPEDSVRNTTVTINGQTFVHNEVVSATKEPANLSDFFSDDQEDDEKQIEEEENVQNQDTVPDGYFINEEDENDFFGL